VWQYAAIVSAYCWTRNPLEFLVRQEVNQRLELVVAYIDAGNFNVLWKPIMRDDFGADRP
jgi:hypothetical protein